ncbi:hypothetical protein DSC47_01200 [Elizabethkingia miricola]|uniref:hypothetical protein n=1 Tax=Elizabethkingia bruuniana TaxID=1756149 RepID=UPI0009997644|nr:hypothetical protein [Elizabethkingia bruuniana]OPC67325.1 hypothetical protein BAY13_16030 [Elizabethkingia bruuniana]RBI93549.1 hypothetical protein DSC47_01200 [Elizabethkingia miricola]
MIAIHKTKVNNVQKIFKTEIDQQRLDAISKLTALDTTTTVREDKNYLKNIINLFTNNNDFLLWDSQKLRDEKDSVGNVPLVPKIVNGIPKLVNGVQKFVKSDIKDKILIALGYSTLRSTFYPKYFKEIGIKACVYCNSQLTISAIKNSKKEYSAKFDVDHYHSKDDYPFLSISLFNLYPACASCNRLKSTNPIELELYSDDAFKTKNSSYKFKLNSNAKAKYLTTKDSNEIEFSFVEPSYVFGVKKFNEVFHIEGVYQTQVDLIEELIIKSQIYNSSYLKILEDNFKKLNLHPELFKRTLVGNYTEDKDIHKRPMSKLVMDIAKELELIK